MKKTTFITMLLTLIIASCEAQQKSNPNFNILPFDLSIGGINPVNVQIDVNGDGRQDILLEYIYRYNHKDKVPLGESGHKLAIYLNKDDNIYELTKVNNAIIWLIHSSVFGVDNKTFCVANEEGGQDPNNYYTYFQYDTKRSDWFLIKHEIFTNNTGKKVIIEQKIYSEAEKLPFELASFDELFGKIHSEAPNLPLFKLIRVKKSFIHSLPNKPTKMFLIEDDNVEILEKREGWLRISFYNEKTKKEIEGWIKKGDVENK
jgi:hypothetical protein